MLRWASSAVRKSMRNTCILPQRRCCNAQPVSTSQVQHSQACITVQVEELRMRLAQFRRKLPCYQVRRDAMHPAMHSYTCSESKHSKLLT